MASQAVVSNGVAALNARQVRPARGQAARRPLAVRAALATPEGGVAAAKQPYDRVFNFSAGPAMLPLDVLEEAQKDLLNWKGSGMSVMEMSHRGKEFMSIAKKAEEDLRTLMAIPDNYRVLFMQGGASTQFSAIPLNLAGEGDVGDYVVTGSWSKKAVSEGKRFLATANVAASGDNKSIPARSDWSLSADAKFVHYCDNETIQGVEFKSHPEVAGGIPLIADVSSNFLSKPMDVSKYGVIYGGVQKNIGPAGAAIAIVRDDLIGHARAGTPTMLDWQTYAENESMYNTPPCFTWYMCGLVFDKLLRDGGLEAIEKRNAEKAAVLYDAIESCGGFFNCPVDPAVQSAMNVPFTIPSSEDLEKEFIKAAGQIGLQTLKGHRSVGGMRASIYNAMPKEGVELLASFMKEFAAKHS
mmetsp:Transcript_23932/g.66434  ORF Transcript_23932/g.66434 Transcript_23932/m.66434 type:complete len:412 (-) Transcript_23932:124-1359(-)